MFSAVNQISIIQNLVSICNSIYTNTIYQRRHATYIKNLYNPLSGLNSSVSTAENKATSIQAQITFDTLDKLLIQNIRCIDLFIKYLILTMAWNISFAFWTSKVKQHRKVNIDDTMNNRLLWIIMAMDIFLYYSSEEMRLLRMHPKSLVLNTTNGTKKEKKALFIITGIDGKR